MFLIIGEGNDRINIEKYIKKFGLSKYIVLTGYKKNIFKYINHSSGLICTSLWEEPGFVIQEAAACKKIILTSDSARPWCTRPILEKVDIFSKVIIKKVLLKILI